MKYSGKLFQKFTTHIVKLFSNDHRWSWLGQFPTTSPGYGVLYSLPSPWLPAQLPNVTAHWLLPNYTAWWQMHMRSSQDSNPLPLDHKSGSLTTWPPSHSGKIPPKIFWIWIMIQISSKIEWLVGSETPTPPNNENSLTTSWVIRKICMVRSTSKSRPNNIRGEKYPYVRPYVRPSVCPQKVSSIWMKFGM